MRNAEDTKHHLLRQAARVRDIDRIRQMVERDREYR